MLNSSDTSSLDILQELAVLKSCSQQIEDFIDSEPANDLSTSEDEESVVEEKDEKTMLLDAYVILRGELADAGILLLLPDVELYSDFLNPRILVYLKRTFNKDFMLNILRTNAHIAEFVATQIDASEEDYINPEESVEEDDHYDFINDLLRLLHEEYPLNTDITNALEQHINIFNNSKFFVYMRYLLTVLLEESIMPVITDNNQDNFMKYLKAFSENHAKLEAIINDYSRQFPEHPWDKIKNIFRNYHSEKCKGDEAIAYVFLYTSPTYNKLSLPDIEIKHRKERNHHIEYWLDHLDTELTEEYFIMMIFGIIDDVGFDHDLASRVFNSFNTKYPFIPNHVDLGWSIINHDYNT